MNADDLPDALKRLVADEISDRAVASLPRSVASLRSELASTLAGTSGWLSAVEKLAVLHRVSAWKSIRRRAQADLLMAAGCYAEAIPMYEAFGHWRKVGDAYLALGNVASARCSYERGENNRSGEYTAFRSGPDLDRLIALAIGREDWVGVIDLVRQGKPDPLGERDVIFAGSSRAKGPLLKLCAHASWRSGEPSIQTEMGGYFGTSDNDLRIVLANAADGAFERDIAKLANPPLMRVKPNSLPHALNDGNTAAVADVAAFFETVDSSYPAALDDIRAWRSSGDSSRLMNAIYWLTRLGNFEVFSTILFRMKCDLDAWIEPHPTDIELYVAHPWLTRACMRELLTSLIKDRREPSPAVLLSCVIQHSASPFELDFEKLDSEARSMEQIRSQLTWAEAVIGRWSAHGYLAEKWASVCAAADRNPRSDPRRLPAYAALCDDAIGVLKTAWARDFNEVRWKAEEGAYLALKLLLPEAEIIRHARPSWLAPQHLDMFIPACGIAIEYQGEQHYRPVEVFGGAAGFAATVERDQRKRRICELAGVRLECIRYDESVDERLRQIAQACQS